MIPRFCRFFSLVPTLHIPFIHSLCQCLLRYYIGMPKSFQLTFHYLIVYGLYLQLFLIPSFSIPSLLVLPYIFLRNLILIAFIRLFVLCFSDNVHDSLLYIIVGLPNLLIASILTHFGRLLVPEILFSLFYISFLFSLAFCLFHHPYHYFSQL